MAGTQFSTPTLLRKILAASFRFFASHRSYGYALSQENQNLTHQNYSHVQAGVLK
jgi:hypothetical protein